MGKIPRLKEATLVYLRLAYYWKGLHTKYDIKIHLGFETKYRKAILKGEIAKRVWQLIREICLTNEVQIIKEHISIDHIHLLLSYPSRL